MRRILVVIEADPHSTERALEGLRMSVGLTLAENRITVLLVGAGRRLLEPEREAFAEWRRAKEYLGALESQGAEIVTGVPVRTAAMEADAVIRWDA